jgi:hypothetical protein
LQVNQPNVVSTANSTTAVLAANATFTGTAEDVLDYACITVQIFSSQASATLGFKPQYSPNGTNWDDGDAFTIAAQVAGNGKFFTFPVQARFFRIVYTNGAALQVTFRLSTIFHRNAIIPSSHRIADTLDDENDAQLIKSITTARRLDGTYDNIKQSNNNELRNSDILDAGTGVEGALVIGTTAVPLRVGGSNIANRKYVTIHNNSLVTFYWGYTASVTISTGTPIFAGQPMGWAVGPNQNIYVIAGIAGNNSRVTEGA